MLAEARMILGAAPESGEQSEKEKGKTDKLWCMLRIKMGRNEKGLERKMCVPQIGRRMLWVLVMERKKKPCSGSVRWIKPRKKKLARVCSAFSNRGSDSTTECIRKLKKSCSQK